MFDIDERLPLEVRTRFYIGGEWKAPRSANRIPIVSPVTDDILVEAPIAGSEDVEQAIAAARAATDSGSWPIMSAADRSAVIERLADALSSRTELLAGVWTAQVGAPIGLTSRLVGQGIARLRYYAQLGRNFAFERSIKTGDDTALIRKEPCGVALLVIPWNAAFPILCHKLGAALAAGCSTIIKPSPASPFDAMIVAQCAHEAGLPPGVVNVVTAGETESAHLVSSSAVDKVSFTGSLAVGRRIAADCAQNITRLTLELGGKNAAIFLDDADLDKALDALMPFAMPFSGQFCFSQSRLLVSRARHAALVTKLKGRIEALVVGDPWDGATQIGPVLNARQADRILGLIEDSRTRGAEIVTGGGRAKPFERGHYIEPTLIDGVTADMTIAGEEIFGPVVTVEVYDRVEDAIMLANAPGLGLSGSVYSRDVDAATAVASQIKSGQVGINGLVLAAAVPFGGRRLSGVGREGGPEGLEAFLETKAILYPGGSERRAVAADNDGLGLISGMLDGSVAHPPLADFLGIRCETVEFGIVTASLGHDPRIENSEGLLHGGAAATLLDATMGAAAHAVQPAGRGVVTLDLTITFLKPIREAQMPVVARAEVLNRGSSTIYVEGEIRDAEGRLMAHAVGNFRSTGAAKNGEGQ